MILKDEFLWDAEIITFKANFDEKNWFFFQKSKNFKNYFLKFPSKKSTGGVQTFWSKPRISPWFSPRNHGFWNPWNGFGFWIWNPWFEIRVLREPLFKPSESIKSYEFQWFSYPRFWKKNGKIKKNLKNHENRLISEGFLKCLASKSIPK